MEAKDTVIPCKVVLGTQLEEAFNKYMLLQAEISFKAGIREVVEWIEANAGLERGDRDAGLCFEDYLHFEYDKWQFKLKEWGISGDNAT